MAQFLRDKEIKNITLDEINLTHINEVFLGRLRALNVPAGTTAADPSFAILFYVIRFDDKGYKLFSLQDVLRCFYEGSKIDRIIITLETVESLRSSRQRGTLLEVKLDKQSTSFTTVTADSEDWVLASFSAMESAIAACKNRNNLIRNPLVLFLIQITGIIFLFLLSYIFATKMATALTIPNAFVIAFIFAILIGSNVWGVMNQVVAGFISELFPNIEFYRPRKDRIIWIAQASVTAIVGAGALFLLTSIGKFLVEYLEALVINAIK